jgi:dihydroorotase
MNADLLFTDVRLLDPSSGLDQHGDLLVRGGRIADLGAGIGRPDGIEIVACDGEILCPGLVDMRASLGEPGFEYRETIASAAAAAASGGITTLAALPDGRPVSDDPALVRLLRARVGQSEAHQPGRADRPSAIGEGDGARFAQQA